MKKITFLCLVFAYSLLSYSQSKTCDSAENEDLLLDLNSITKCSVEPSSTSKSSKSDKISVTVSSRKRVVRSRDKATGLTSENKTHGLADIKKQEVLKNLSLANSSTNNLEFVSFDLVDQIPLFKSCQSTALNQQGLCFKQKLTKHIQKHFTYPQHAHDEGIQGRVIVYFVINKDGTIGKMNANAPYKGQELALEAQRIIKKLPDFIPGEHNGSKINVKYAIPINFKIPGVKPTNIKGQVENAKLGQIYTFNDVEKLPAFKKCESVTGKDLGCFNQQLIQHISDNFAYPQKAVDHNISGAVYVKFVIDKNGKVTNIQTRGPQNGVILEIAAKKLVEKLGSFKPAMKDGQPVNVSYSFPVNFKLD